MNKRELIAILFEKGKIAGLSDMEVYIQGGKEFDIKIFKGEIDKYSISSEEGLSFRGVYNGKMGYSYTEKIDETSVDMLIQDAIDNARAIDSEDEEEILEGSKEYKHIEVFNQSLESISPSEKIEFTKLLEQEALKLDKRVVAVYDCLYGEQSSYRMLVNTKGLDLKSKSNMAHAYISVMLKDGEDVKTADKYIIGNDFSMFDAKVLAQEAVKEAISMLGADSIESEEYPVILRNNVAADIMEAFIPVFIAENVQKDISLLKGKLGEKIANSLITIVDDPFMENGVASCGFDGEGVSTIYKKIVDKGVLKTFLHNSKTAKKDGIESTGNAHKGSYKSPISISSSNMYIENGTTSYEEIVKSTEKGLLIIDVQGLHSGLNTISGDFSLSAYGYLIENGEIERPVNQITIAGNFYELINDIEAVGNDLKFTLPGFGYIGSPTLKIKKLSISGK